MRIHFTTRKKPKTKKSNVHTPCGLQSFYHHHQPTNHRFGRGKEWPRSTENNSYFFAISLSFWPISIMRVWFKRFFYVNDAYFSTAKKTGRKSLLYPFFSLFCFFHKKNCWWKSGCWMMMMIRDFYQMHHMWWFESFFLSITICERVCFFSSFFFVCLFQSFWKIQTLLDHILMQICKKINQF